jgi:hypothetical protein
MQVPPRLGLTAGPRHAFLLAFPALRGVSNKTISRIPAFVFFYRERLQTPKNATTDYSKLVTGLQQIDKK